MGLLQVAFKLQSLRALYLLWIPGNLSASYAGKSKAVLAVVIDSLWVHEVILKLDVQVIISMQIAAVGVEVIAQADKVLTQ